MAEPPLAVAETQAITPAMQLQVLVELYKEQCAQGRHAEAQRHTVSAMMFTLCAALIAVMGTMKFELSAAPLAVCVIALGLYARRFVSAFEAKWDQLSRRQKYYREQMQALAGVDPVPEAVDKAAIGRDGKPRLRRYWRRSFDGLAVIGLLCLAVIAWRASPWQEEIGGEGRTAAPCRAIAHHMLTSTASRADDAAMFTALGCRLERAEKVTYTPVLAYDVQAPPFPQTSASVRRSTRAARR